MHPSELMAGGGSGLTQKTFLPLSPTTLLVPKAKANIEIQESNAILTITLNRPDRLNILDLETRKEILRVLESHESNREIRCLLLTAR